jgi:putative phage-type endonuclease
MFAIRDNRMPTDMDCSRRLAEEVLMTDTEELIQGSPEWLQARCGLVTASRISDVIARTKTGWGSSRANYKAQLVIERLTGKPADTYQSPAMLEGIRLEPFARQAYSETTWQTVDQVGLVMHPTIPMAGCSPDGLVNDDGMVEIKCPLPATHLEYLLAGTVPTKYIPQLAFQLACHPKRQWVDFVSYCPSLPDKMQLFCKRYDRDDVYISQLEEMVKAFLDEVSETVEALKRKYA